MGLTVRCKHCAAVGRPVVNHVSGYRDINPGLTVLNREVPAPGGGVVTEKAYTYAYGPFITHLDEDDVAPVSTYRCLECDFVGNEFSDVGEVVRVPDGEEYS